MDIAHEIGHLIDQTGGKFSASYAFRMAYAEDIERLKSAQPEIINVFKYAGQLSYQYLAGMGYYLPGDEFLNLPDHPSYTHGRRETFAQAWASATFPNSTPVANAYNATFKVLFPSSCAFVQKLYEQVLEEIPKAHMAAKALIQGNKPENQPPTTAALSL